MIEYEVRTFLEESDYERLLLFFEKNAKKIDEEDQETHYFDTKQDVRIQKSTRSAKIWLKKGELHDDHREEIEILVQKEQFEELQKLFSALNYKVLIKWFRNRKQYAWKGATICLDNTKGYGYILEIEKLSEKVDDTIKEELAGLLQELEVKDTPKSVFAQKYEDYKKNWETLTR